MKPYLIKILIPVIALMLGLSGMAQQHGFVRIFDLQGKKIYKGHVISITDSSLTLKDNVTFMATEIGMIKTKRSAGHNIGWGAAIGAATFAGLTAAFYALYPDDDNDFALAATVIFSGAAIGAGVGAAGGLVSFVIKKSKTYEINGDLDNWMAFKDKMENK